MRVSPRQLLVLVALATTPAATFAQGGSAARVSAAQAELRAAPDGARVATLSRGTSVTRGATNGAWREVTVEGWVPARAVAPAGSGGRLAVQGSATLHAAPDGAAVGTAAAGMVLREVERRGAWIRVRRTGWVRADGLGAASSASAPTSGDARRSTPASTAAKSTSATASRAARDTASRRAAPTPARTADTAARGKTSTTRPASSATVASAPPAARSGTSKAAAPARTTGTAARPASPAAAAPLSARPAAPAARRGEAVVLHAAPGAAGQVAVVEPGAPVQVLARQGEWTRVRVEGWTRAPVAGRPAVAAPTGPVTLAALRANPDVFVGREVDWTLRFVAVQVADSVRSDFRPGEAFLLTRDPNGETGYVYVAVTPQQAAAARRFAPMQPFRMTGRIRVPRSPLMGHPIVDLVRLR